MTRSVTGLTGPPGAGGLAFFLMRPFALYDHRRSTAQTEEVKSLKTAVENSFYCLEAYTSKRTPHPS